MAKPVIKPIMVYKVEVGVLLPKEHNDYEAYACVYDKKHAFYDENVVFFTNKRKAINYVRAYIKKGVINTYGIVSALKYDSVAIYGADAPLRYSFEDMKTIEEQGILEEYEDIFGEENWDVKNVIYNGVKKVPYSIVRVNDMRHVEPIFECCHNT